MMIKEVDFVLASSRPTAQSMTGYKASLCLSFRACFGEHEVRTGLLAAPPPHLLLSNTSICGGGHDHNLVTLWRTPGLTDVSLNAC